MPVPNNVVIVALINEIPYTTNSCPTRHIVSKADQTSLIRSYHGQTQLIWVLSSWHTNKAPEGMTMHHNSSRSLARSGRVRSRRSLVTPTLSAFAARSEQLGQTSPPETPHSDRGRHLSIERNAGQTTFLGGRAPRLMNVDAVLLSQRAGPINAWCDRTTRGPVMT